MSASTPKPSRRPGSQRYYQPYHQAIERAVDAAIAAGKPPVIVSMHSFTQAWKGVPRPWAVGVLWDKDPRLALALLEALRAIPGHRGRRQRSLFRATQRRYALPARDAARLGACADRGAAGSDPRSRRAGRMGGAARRGACARCCDETGSALHAIELHGSYTDGRPARAPVNSESGRRHGREDADRDRGGRLPAARAASARADRRAEYRPHGARRVLPELPRRLVSGGGRGERASR